MKKEYLRKVKEFATRSSRVKEERGPNAAKKSRFSCRSDQKCYDDCKRISEKVQKFLITNRLQMINTD